MRFIKTISVLLLLFVLPAGSWFFLKDGLNWRKAKVEELQPKGQMLDYYNLSINEESQFSDAVKTKTTLVKIDDALSEDDIAIIAQFKNAHTFMFLLLNNSTKHTHDISDSKCFEKIFIADTRPTEKKFNESKYLLLDTSSLIRQYYQSTNKETLTRIVEDIAIVLPRKITPDIEVRKPVQQ